MTLSPTALEAAEHAVKTCLASKEVSGYLNAPNIIATATITAYLAQREKEGWVMVPKPAQGLELGLNEIYTG